MSATALISGALGLRRSVLWVAALAASYAVSVLYLYFGPSPTDPNWPPQSGIAMLCDAGVCLLIFRFGKRRWETGPLYSLMLGSVAVSLLYTTGLILGFPPLPPSDIYAIILEGINYAALALILGTAILNRIGAADAHLSSGWMGIVHPLSVLLFARHEPSKVLRRKD